MKNRSQIKISEKSVIHNVLKILLKIAIQLNFKAQNIFLFTKKLAITN